MMLRTSWGQAVMPTRSGIIGLASPYEGYLARLNLSKLHDELHEER